MLCVITFAEDIWIHALDHHTKGKNIIIDDVRFPNEVDWIHDNGGFVININRDRTELELADNHESENWNLYYDCGITNSFDDNFTKNLMSAMKRPLHMYLYG